MKKRGLLLLMAVAVGWLLPGLAWGQGFKPSKPIEAVVHTDPGGGSDIFARAIAEMVEKEKILPQRMHVLNKAGGSGLVMMAYLAEKKAETHTIGFSTNTQVVTPLTRKEAKYTTRDLTPIARLVLEPSIVVVKADSPYKTFRDFLEAAKKNPGTLKMSGGSVTSVENLFRLLIQKATGAKWDFISFPGGGERISNLLGGNVQLMMPQPAEVSEHIRGGNLRVIAALTEKRMEAFPNVPTIKEDGINVPILVQARGVLAPPGIAPDVVSYWEGAFGRLVKAAAWKKYLKENQLEDGYLGSGQFRDFLDRQTDLFRSVLQEAGVKVAR
ncbi:MAG: tripartite tricarboxylate transporter substrate binding protein [Deltaproteobacteria bacterium]|nr:tripartite tricarboxylate transporter substrate binding protein [Deltaproteobacteria bacterium]